MNNQVCIAWSNLTLSKKSFLKNTPKIVLLNGIKGWAEFGNITAVMGPSGSGLTSLLHCLNGSDVIDNRFIEKKSKILLNSEIKIRSTFITNNEKDFLIMGLSVKQNLIYASRLKNSDEVIDHEINVRKIMSDLMISDVANNTSAMCSGGELKRLAIAVELTAIRKPNLILMDEPTTGLDSHIALVVSDK